MIRTPTASDSATMASTEEVSGSSSRMVAERTWPFCRSTVTALRRVPSGCRAKMVPSVGKVMVLGTR